ncbi:hypothetical protein BD289DRAFT_108883 [Coniella lustricola]|uniref:Uncharacterized protein n=1 Tax=Coniella lustricola TaxID=2025994 RepID=A0A2T2ZXH1_9PEZI|nr:hypothetical protein BD289DRAFT_108883 [Coniella lustricola]
MVAIGCGLLFLDYFWWFFFWSFFDVLSPACGTLSLSLSLFPLCLELQHFLLSFAHFPLLVWVFSWVLVFGFNWFLSIYGVLELFFLFCSHCWIAWSLQGQIGFLFAVIWMHDGLTPKDIPPSSVAFYSAHFGFIPPGVLCIAMDCIHGGSPTARYLSCKEELPTDMSAHSDISFAICLLRVGNIRLRECFF